MTTLVSDHSFFDSAVFCTIDGSKHYASPANWRRCIDEQPDDAATPADKRGLLLAAVGRDAGTLELLLRLCDGQISYRQLASALHLPVASVWRHVQKQLALARASTGSFGTDQDRLAKT